MLDLHEAEPLQQESGGGPQSVRDHHRPLAEQRLERRRAGGDQHHIRRGQNLTRAALHAMQGDTGRCARPGRLEAGTHRGIHQRRHEPQIRASRRQPRGSTGERLGEPRHLAHTTARQHCDHRIGGAQAERCPRRIAIRTHRELIRERMTDEPRRDAMPFVESRLERQQAEDAVTGLADAAHPALPPSPDLRADILDRSDPPRFHPRSEPEVELRCIDTDEHIGTQLRQFGDQPATQLQEPRQMPQHLGEPHDGELLGVGQRFAARSTHPRPRDAHDAHARQPRTQHIDQGGTEVVSRGLARHQGDHGRRPRSRIGRRDGRGHGSLA